MPTVRDTRAELQAAIDFGELAAQHAPAGHPIFGTLRAARQTVAYLDALIPWWSFSGPETPSGADGMAHDDINQIYGAAATLTSDPGAPLPVTTFAPVQSLPWPWIGAGAAAVLGAVVYFYVQHRGR